MPVDEHSEYNNGYWSDVVDTSRLTTPPIFQDVSNWSSKRSIDDLEKELWNETWSPEYHSGQETEDMARSSGWQTSYSPMSSISASPSQTFGEGVRRTRMQTGCIPCLRKGLKCDPRNPGCKRVMSDNWSINKDEENIERDSTSLTMFRPDPTWRRSWRERHSLNFFVNFSAPQMAGFFDSTFWQRMIVQMSYHEPAILHAITAIGALHECIMQRVFTDERRKGQAMEFALNQCNKAISCLRESAPYDTSLDPVTGERTLPKSRLALTTCVLFTCFEAMQGRCDSAVNHALQGRRLLEATGKSTVSTMTPAEGDDVEQMRPIVERLEVQATALLDKDRKPGMSVPDQQTPPLPPVNNIASLDHAHNTLHTALNSIMRFMQAFNPSAPRDQIAIRMAEKYLRYAPWFSTWESAFTTYLGERRENMSNIDVKRAMVLKANHLTGQMLASVDQSAGPVAYDIYETEFKAIVDLAREVLTTFSCPPLATITGGSSGTPYLSFSLWVTDPLWMAISRCRNPSIRQAAFTLLSQNPRQEGIWHAGPQLSNNKYMRRAEADTSFGKENAKADKPSDHKRRRTNVHDNIKGNEDSSSPSDNSVAADSDASRTRSTASSGAGKVRDEWVNLRAQIVTANQTTESQDGYNGPPRSPVRIIPRYKSYCTGRCSIPSLEELKAD